GGVSNPESAGTVARPLTGGCGRGGCSGGVVGGESRGPCEPGMADGAERLASGGQDARSERPSNHTPRAPPEPRDDRARGSSKKARGAKHRAPELSPRGSKVTAVRRSTSCSAR